MTTYIGLPLLEVAPGSHAPGMGLNDHHCLPLGLDLLAHQVSPAQGLQLDRPLPHGLVLPRQLLAPGDSLQALKAHEDLWRQEGGELRGEKREVGSGARRPSPGNREGCSSGDSAR